MATQGILVVIGGGESRAGPVLREFVRLAGGERSRIAVLTAASDEPVDLEREYCEAFRRLGAAEVSCLRTSHRHDAEARGAADVVRRATAAFLTGGSQANLVGRIRGTPVHEALRRGIAAGLVVGGTSAGASAMSETMLVSGTSEGNPHAGVAELGPGLGFLRGLIIDQHFTERGRLGRLLGAIADRPGELGVGIAEDTALVVTGETFEVVGSGSVTVLDPAAITHRGCAAADPRGAIALCGVTLHSLPSGYGFDLGRRLPLPPASKTDAA